MDRHVPTSQCYSQRQLRAGQPARLSWGAASSGLRTPWKRVGPVRVPRAGDLGCRPGDPTCSVDTTSSSSGLSALPPPSGRDRRGGRAGRALRWGSLPPSLPPPRRPSSLPALRVAPAPPEPPAVRPAVCRAETCPSACSLAPHLPPGSPEPDGSPATPQKGDQLLLKVGNV